MPANTLGDPTAIALEHVGHVLKGWSSPEVTNAARAVTVLAACLKVTAIGTTASNALAAAVTASLAARPAANQPVGDSTRYNVSARCVESFQHAGSASLSGILDNLAGDRDHRTERRPDDPGDVTVIPSSRGASGRSKSREGVGTDGMTKPRTIIDVNPGTRRGVTSRSHRCSTGCQNPRQMPRVLTGFIVAGRA